MTGLRLETLHRAGISVASVAIPVEGRMPATAKRADPRWTVEVRVAAPNDRVWEAIDDLSAIPLYHPEVDRVELIGGASRRAAGVRYRCVIEGGRRAGWCEERVIEHVPGRLSVTDFPADSWGIGRMLEDFRVELSTEGAEDGGTTIRLAGHYRPRSAWLRPFDRLLLRPRMRSRALATLRGLARHVEARA